MLRSAKLVCDQGEFLCILRDISESGVRLRIFSPVCHLTGMVLEMATGDTFPIKLVWSQRDEAGFQFMELIDVQRFISESGPYPKRQIRLRLQHPAQITVAGEHYSATILDLSRQGAGIETQRHLAIGQKLTIAARGLQTFDATVCWRRQPAYGLVFCQLMGLEEMAIRTARIQGQSLVRHGPQESTPAPSAFET